MVKQNMDDAQLDESMTDDGGSNPRVYELGFHLDPELPTEEVKKAYQTIHEFIATKGTIIAEGEPQKIQLAYTISRQEVSGRRDFDSAYFSWVVYEATPADHDEVVTSATTDKHIIRFIDILTTKDAARHSVEIRELAMKTPEPTEDPEAVLGAEVDAAIENVVI